LKPNAARRAQSVINKHVLDLNLHPLTGQQYEVVAREEAFMEGPLEPNMGPSLADVLFCCVRLKVLMQGFLHFLLGNFYPESNSSAPTAFSHKRNPASCGQHREVNNTR
jgi:hypothetical protein